MNTFSGVGKFEGIPSSTKFFKFKLEITLVAMSGLVPQGNSTIVFAVGSMLMNYKVCVNCGFNVVMAIGGIGHFPLEIVLMTVGGSAPDGNFGFIVGSSTMNVSNSVISKMTYKITSFSALGEFFGALVVLLLLDSNKSPFKVCLVNIIPLGNVGVVG